VRSFLYHLRRFDVQKCSFFLSTVSNDEFFISHILGYQEAAWKGNAELLRKVKVSIMDRMSEDDIGQIRDELRVYKEQLDGRFA